MSRTTTKFLVAGLAGLVIGMAACLIPDRGIIVLTTDPCGEEWAAQTVGAYGYKDDGQQIYIRTDTDGWVSRSYCLNQEQAAQMLDPANDLPSELALYIATVCQERADELDLVDLDQTCITTANIAYIGECQQPPAGCSDPPAETGGDETGGGETGGSETGSGLHDGFEDLDLAKEIRYARGEYLVSEHLIAVALADPTGLSYDGTTLEGLVDPQGKAQGFMVVGANRHNLGGHLGLDNGDVLIEIDGRSTLSYPQLLDAGVRLLEAESAKLTIVRDGSRVSMRYRRD